MTTKRTNGRTKKAAAKTPTRGSVKTAKRQTATTQEPAIAPARQSKKDLVLSLLRRPDGATLEELMTATGWQAHSVRGFISGTVRKKLGVVVVTMQDAHGAPGYRIAQH